MFGIESSKSRTIACIDIGSNSVHLVVASIDDQEHIVIRDSDKITVRLASYLDKKMYLRSEGIQACVESVRKLVNIARYHTPKVRCVATYAVRAARNSRELIEAVRKATGVEVEIVNGREEAWLEFLGAQQALQFENTSTLLVDIGGGSTEITFYDAPKRRIPFIQSFNVGAVTLTERFLLNGIINSANLKNIEERVHEQLVGKLEVPAHKIKLAVASSGTAKSVARMIAKMFYGDTTEYNLNGYEFSAVDLEKLYQKLIQTKSVDQIKNDFPIDEQRSEIIMPGVIILREITRDLKIDMWTISSYSLREGLVVDTHRRFFAKNRKTYARTRLQAIRNLAERFQIDPQKGKMILSKCMSIYEILAETKSLRKGEKIQDEEIILQAASYLCQIGKSVNFSKYHKHSAYIIKNCDIIGFTQHELIMMAMIIQYHRKGLLTVKKLADYPQLIPLIERLKFLSLCLRLSMAMNRTWHKDFTFNSLTIVGEQLVFEFPRSYEEKFEIELFKLASESESCRLTVGKTIAIKFKD